MVYNKALGVMYEYVQARLGRGGGVGIMLIYATINMFWSLLMHLGFGGSRMNGKGKTSWKLS